jgi:hypothetical protein
MLAARHRFAIELRSLTDSAPPLFCANGFFGRAINLLMPLCLPRMTFRANFAHSALYLFRRRRDFC